MSLKLEILDKSCHDFKNFDCSKPELTKFLKQFALKNQKLGISKTWVIFDDEIINYNNKYPVLGYFTLALQSIEATLIDDEKLPNYPLPITLLARIAVDIKVQRQGLGRTLLGLALKTALKLCNEGLPTYAVVLDVLDDEALNFYQKFNFFKKIKNSDKKLIVPMKVIAQLAELQ